MGGCCSSKKSNSTASDEVVIELNSQVVNVMQCKAGKHGNGVSVSTSRDSGKVIVTGLSAGGILLGSCALDCDGTCLIHIVEEHILQWFTSISCY